MSLLSTYIYNLKNEEIPFVASLSSSLNSSTFHAAYLTRMAYEEIELG